MKFHYYRFPEGTDPMVRLKEGCPVILKSGGRVFWKTIPESAAPMVDRVNVVVDGISAIRAQRLLQKYGGTAWTKEYISNGFVRYTEIDLPRRYKRKRNGSLK